MSEGGDAMSNSARLGNLMRVLGVLKGLPRKLAAGQVLLFSLLLGNTMGMRGAIV